MTELLNYFKDKIETIHPGAYTKIKHQKEINISKNHPNETLIKVSCGVYRIGITYANLIERKGKETQPLKWGENLKDYEKYFIKHTKKDTKEVCYYLKVFTTKHHKTKSYYILNDEIVDKKYLIKNNYLPKEETKPLLTFSIPLQNIIEIGS